MSKDITEKVMERVMRFEKRRVVFWLWLFGVVTVVTLLVLAGVGYLTLREISMRESWELLTLFAEDREIITEYWRDVTETLWIGLPHALLVLIGVVFSGFFAWLFLTRRKRTIVAKKRLQLARYQHTHHDKLKEANNMKQTVIIIFIMLILGGGAYGIYRSTSGQNSGTVETQIQTQKQKTNSQEGFPSQAKEEGVGVDTSLQQVPLTIASPKSGRTVSISTITVKGKTASRAEVFVNDAETAADVAGNFSVSVTLDEGENYLLIVATDEAGNASEQEITVIYQVGE